MKFGEFIKGADKEGKEKHVPFIEVKHCTGCNETKITVIVGKEVKHPNTVEHHIAWTVNMMGLFLDNPLLS
jgi:superoxide reductase